MSITRGYTFGTTETVTAAKLHALVDDASISGIVNAEIAANAAIDSSKINFTLSDYVTIAGTQTITGAKTFSASTAFAGASFSTPLSNDNLSPIATASYTSGLSLFALASTPSGAGMLPLANLNTVSVAKGGTGQTTAQAAIDALLPSQTGNSGKALTTDGSNSSWGTFLSSSSLLTSGVALLSTTSVSLNANGNTQIYTIPSGKSLILDKVIIVVGAGGASASRIVSVGVAAGTTAFVNAQTLSPAPASGEMVVLTPITTNRVGTTGEVVVIAVSGSGTSSTTNTAYLFGTLY